tara:strand:- start:110 stop:751 length:642 start_codon:yes stop_codon:yes gene_type:complete
MAWTYTTLTQAIKDYVQSTETSFTNNIPVFIKQAESRIVRTASLPVFRKNVTGSMTSGNQYLGIPSDFLSPYSLAIVNSSSYEYLVNKDVNYIRELYPVAATTGIPKYYALFDNSSFIIGPTPNAGFSSELHYHYKPQSIVDASDGTSWLGTNAEDVLLYGSLIEAYTFLKGEPDLLGLYQQRHDTALELLIRESDGRDRTDAYRTGQPSLVA